MFDIFIIDVLSFCRRARVVVDGHDPHRDDVFFLRHASCDLAHDHALLRGDQHFFYLIYPADPCCQFSGGVDPAFDGDVSRNHYFYRHHHHLANRHDDACDHFYDACDYVSDVFSRCFDSDFASDVSNFCVCRHCRYHYRVASTFSGHGDDHDCVHDLGRLFWRRRVPVGPDWEGDVGQRNPPCPQTVRVPFPDAVLDSYDEVVDVEVDHFEVLG